VIADELVDHLQKNVPFFKESIRVENCLFEGNLLKNSFYKSIFSEDSKLVPLVYGDHVGSMHGTGLVHTAPALGQDDFKVGLRNNLTTTCVIDELGQYKHDDPVLNKFGLNGLTVVDTNTTLKIKEILGENILHEHSHIHSYPYDWRTKKPVIIRSSMQWFIDTNNLKGLFYIRAYYLLFTLKNSKKYK
jgi:isoleucyl-tRNA synthetase